MLQNEKCSKSALKLKPGYRRRKEEERAPRGVRILHGMVKARLLGENDGHVVLVSEGLAARRAFSRTVGDQVLHAALAESVAAELQHSIAEVGIADGADGDFL